jgi:hypothetical protein
VNQACRLDTFPVEDHAKVKLARTQTVLDLAGSSFHRDDVDMAFDRRSSTMMAFDHQTKMNDVMAMTLSLLPA